MIKTDKIKKTNTKNGFKIGNPMNINKNKRREILDKNLNKNIIFIKRHFFWLQAIHVNTITKFLN